MKNIHHILYGEKNMKRKKTIYGVKYLTKMIAHEDVRGSRHSYEYVNTITFGSAICHPDGSCEIVYDQGEPLQYWICD